MDDYKVIFIYIDADSDFDFSITNSFVVFSFKFQRWTQSKPFPYSGFLGDMVTVNGVLHTAAFWRIVWPRYFDSYYLSEYHSSLSLRSSSSNGDDNKSSLYERDFRQIYVTVYYDMVDEKFKEMPPPNCLNRGDKFRLAVMSGCLSLYCNTIDENYAEVWTMKQYGEQNSWTKLFVIPHLVRVTPTHLVYVMPLCATKKGDEVAMIVDDGLRIAIYYPEEKKKFRGLQHTCIPRES
ncbi:uncharacterized protein LOC132301608 [Cornus florida]|uniref:uncharacterized protein LOC132301608 n=1 Tax=Cornus florida TaxID=4283 RepID=UPI00289F488F|nr:uncharacterized protein LOC132301608 [Cornus florida]